MKECRQAALFAPDYDTDVDQEIVDRALARLSPQDRKAILSYDEDGLTTADTTRLFERGLILHGLAEIFEMQLTPLGLAIRRHIR